MVALSSLLRDLDVVGAMSEFCSKVLKASGSILTDNLSQIAVNPDFRLLAKLVLTKKK